MRRRLWLRRRLCLLAATSAASKGNAADAASKQEASAPHERRSAHPTSVRLTTSWSVMTFLRIVIPLYLFDLSMIFSENRYPLFRIML